MNNKLVILHKTEKEKNFFVLYNIRIYVSMYECIKI